MTHPVPNMLKLITFFEEFGFTRIVLGRTVNPVNPSPVDCTEEDFAELARQNKEEIIPWVLGKLVCGRDSEILPLLSLLPANGKGRTLHGRVAFQMRGLPGNDHGGRGRDPLPLPPFCRHEKLADRGYRQRAGHREMQTVLAGLPGKHV